MEDEGGCRERRDLNRLCEVCVMCSVKHELLPLTVVQCLIETKVFTLVFLSFLFSFTYRKNTNII